MVKQEDRRAVTRGAIIAAASKAFGCDGFSAVSIDQIAACAGVAKGAVYHHFASKDALFEAVLETVSSAILSDVVAAIGISAIGKGRDFWEEFALGNHAFFVACSDPERARILLHDGPAVLGWERWRQIDRRHFGGLLRAALSRAMDEAVLVPINVEVLSRTLLGAVTEAVISCAEADDFMACAEVYLEVLGTLVASLAVRPA